MKRCTDKVRPLFRGSSFVPKLVPFESKGHGGPSDETFVLVDRKNLTGTRDEPVLWLNAGGFRLGICICCQLPIHEDKLGSDVTHPLAEKEVNVELWL